jgi:hypothetical protein
MTSIGPVAQQGVISTQVEHINDRPTAVEATQEVAASPPPPAPETGRGAKIDTSA